MATPKPRELVAGKDYPADCYGCLMDFEGPKPYNGAVKMPFCPHADKILDPSNYNFLTSSNVEVDGGAVLHACSFSLAAKAPGELEKETDSASDEGAATKTHGE